MEKEFIFDHMMFDRTAVLEGLVTPEFVLQWNFFCLSLSDDNYSSYIDEAITLKRSFGSQAIEYLGMMVEACSERGLEDLSNRILDCINVGETSGGLN